MSTSENETSRYLKTFMRNLGKNRLGQPFIRLVSTSLDRKTSYNEKIRSIGFQGQRRSDNFQQRAKMRRVKTQARDDKLLNSFRIKQGQLGDSVHVIDFMKSRVDKKVRSRQITSEKGGSKLHSLVMDRKSLVLQQMLRARDGYLKMNKLGHILSTLAGNSNVTNVRIYKQRLKKFYNARFIKQKLTSFLEYEYIENYDSQLRYIQTLISLKLQEIYFLCFIVLDQDSDGLISNGDLFNLATASIQSNPLINKDIYKIFQYITYYRNQKIGMKINDSVSDQQFFKGENITLQKYRLLEFKSQKEKAKKLELQSEKKSWKTIQAQDSKGILLSRRTGKHLFSVRLEDNQGQSAIKQLRKKFAQIQLQTSVGYNFKINFNRFKNIFIHNIPETYFDILFIVSGIKLPDKEYLDLNFDIDERPPQDEEEKQPDPFDYFKQKIDSMRCTYRQSKVQRLWTDLRPWRSVRKSK